MTFRREANRKSLGLFSRNSRGPLDLLKNLGRSGLLAACCTAGSLSLFSGCTSFSSGLGSIFSGGCLGDAIEMHRNRTCALKAWYRREHNFCDQANLRDFKAGFVDGYVAIADGKPGCPPSVPPKQYWSWAYQTPEGQAQMAAWYAGYPYGVQAAKDDGLNSWNHINLGPNFQTKPSQGWGQQYGQPGWNSYGGETGLGPQAAPIQPSTVPGETSILQDPSAQYFEPGSSDNESAMILSVTE